MASNYEGLVDRLMAIRPAAGGSAYGGGDPPCWAPDGSAILFVSSLGGQADLWTVSPEGGFPTRLTNGIGTVGFLASRQALWSPTGDYVAYVRQEEGSHTHEVWLNHADGSGAFKLTRLGGNVGSMNWAPDGRSLVVSNNRYGSYDIYTVEVPSGKATRLTSDSRYEVYPSFTPDGQQILYVRLNDAWTDHDVILLERDGSEPRVILQDTDFFDYHFGRTFGYPKVSPDGSTLLFRSHRSGWINYWVVPLTGGEPRQIAPADADQSDAAWSPDGRSIAYIENHDGTLELRVVATTGGTPRVLVQPENGICLMPQWSPDGTQISFLHESPTLPQDLWVVNVGTGARRQLPSPAVRGRVAAALVQPEKIRYTTWDGLQITAYLYAPTDREPGQRLPGIMLIHGGPTSQYLDNFQMMAQFFAQAGYVVMLPNIRGSSGYGKAFEKLNNRDWGHGDLKDVLAGIEYLKRLGFVDTDRMGITGTSYGGCMSMAAVGFAPGVFKAAIPMSGYGDWTHFYFEQELRHIKLMEYEFGPYEGNEEIYRKCSPIHSLDQATTPTFLIHGAGGYPNSEASALFAKELERKYKTFKYKTYEGDNYYVRAPKNVRQMLLDMADWFDLYLQGNLQ